MAVGSASGRQVPRDAASLSLSNPCVSLPHCPFLCRPATRRTGIAAEQRKEKEGDRILLRRTLALATGAPAIYFPGFQSPKPLISAPQRQWSASGRRRGAWRRRRRSALSRSLVYSAVAACCCGEYRESKMERSAGEEVNGKPGDEVSVEERSAETSSERKKQ